MIRVALVVATEATTSVTIRIPHPIAGATLSVTTCTESFALPPDSYTATVITYDGLSGAGNALSSAQLVPFIVQQGVAVSPSPLGSPETTSPIALTP